VACPADFMMHSAKEPRNKGGGRSMRRITASNDAAG
jgi:hypothetical protein